MSTDFRSGTDSSRPGRNADALIREAATERVVLDYADRSFTKPPPLAEATVAIVTTAGLHRQGQDGWKRGDESFRILEASDRNLVMSHLSPNFDRAGFAIDVNVVFPTDRLRELAAEGIIKAAAPRNLSFMGAAGETLATIRLDSGPAAAKVLRDDGVDVVLLTGV